MENGKWKMINGRAFSFTIFNFPFSILLLLSVVCHAAIVPADSDAVRSLNGSWRFKLEHDDKLDPGAPRPMIDGLIPAVDHPPASEPFYQIDYKEDESWHDIGV